MSQNEGTLQYKTSTVMEEVFKAGPGIEEEARREQEQQEQADKKELHFFNESEAISLMTILDEGVKVREKSLSSEKVHEKERDKAADLRYLMDMEIIEYDKTAMENRSPVEKKHAAELRRLSETHRLSNTARLERDRIVKLLKIDSITRESILKSDKTLNEVLSSYSKKEERDGIAKRGKEFAEQFVSIKEELNNDPFLCAEEKALRLYRIAKPFAMEMAVYKELYLGTLESGERLKDILNILNRYTMLLNYFESDDKWSDKEKEALYKELGIRGAEEKSASEKTFGDNDEVLKAIRRKARRIDNLGKKDQIEDDEETLEEKQEQKERADQTLSEKQKNGIYALDRFLIKNIHQSHGNAAFLNRILSLSERERLIVYFLVEKDRLNCPDAADVVISQHGYIPDEGTFSIKMTKGRHNKTRRFLGMFSDRFRPVLWEKLEAAMEIVTHSEVEDTMLSMADFSDTIKEERAKVLSDADEPMRIDEELTDEDREYIQRLSENEASVLRLEAERNECLDKYLQALLNCRKAVEARDSAGFFTRKSKTEEAKKKSEAALNALNELKSADMSLTDAMNSCLNIIPEKDYIILASEDELTQKLGSDYKKGYEAENKKTSQFVTSQSLGLLAKMDKIPLLFGSVQGNSSISMAATLGTVNVTASSFLAISGIMGLICGVAGVVQLFKHIKSGVGVSDMLADAAKIGSTIASTTWSPINGGLSLVLAVPKALKTTGLAGETMEKAVGSATTFISAGTIAVSGIKLAADSVNAVKEIRHGMHVLDAETRFEKLIDKGTLKGDEAAYARNIGKLEDRKATQSLINSGVDIVTDIGTLGTALVSLFLPAAAPAVALAWAAVACTAAVTSKVANYFAEKSRKKKTVEEFLQLDNEDDSSPLVMLKENKDAKDEYLAHKSEYRERMKEHMAAELGFVSTESLHRHIIKNYSEFLYRNLFFEEGDETKPIFSDAKKYEAQIKMLEIEGNETGDETEEETVSVNARQKTELSQACYEAVKGLGLRVKYPKYKKRANPVRKPSAAQIAAKLGG
ncbi:MAG: hypothetical protein IJR19_07100 [Lachnospiraceae bacterium]|nr:hypothetical protein [Lachnospiraceae bacterium]